MSATSETTNDLRFSRGLPIKHVSIAAQRFLKQVEGRRSGDITSLKTGYNKLDKLFLDGVEWDKVFTIAGMSGSGKSIVLENLKRNFIKYNNPEEFYILSFEFEMASHDQLARNVSGTMKKDLKWIYSVDNPLGNIEVEKIKDHVETLSTNPIYISEVPGTADQIQETILSFVNLRNLKSTGKKIIVTIDHTLLTKSKGNDNPKIRIDDLCNAFLQAKKQLIDMGIPCIFIILSQLNRDIEGKDRVLNSALHYPTKSDVNGSDVVYQTSDYLMIVHKPARVNGMGTHYGPGDGIQHPRGLPVYNPNNPEQAMVYWHVIKNRWGDEGIIKMVDNYQFASINEYHDK